MTGASRAVTTGLSGSTRWTSTSRVCSRRPVAAFLLIALASAAFSVDEKPQPACALIKACGLAVQAPSCTAERSKPIDGVVYDSARCAEPRDLMVHGVAPLSAADFAVFTFLGGRYRIVYDLSGEAPISVARFDFLANDLPFAAKLATRFSKTAYDMRYVDGDQTASRRFYAARGDKLTGEARRLFIDGSGGDAPVRRVYFGTGASKFGPWKLHGSAYVEIRVKPKAANPAALSYEVRIRTAPVNAMVNAIMRLGVFKGMVGGQIDDTMKDLVGAAAALTPANLDKTLADSAFTPEERLKIRALAAIP